MDTKYFWPESHFSVLPPLMADDTLDSLPQATPFPRPAPPPLLCPCPSPQKKTPFTVTATGEHAYVKT